MVDELLLECGFVLSAKKAHANEYRYKDIVLYSVPAVGNNLVVSPEDYIFLKEYVCKKYHNSNLTAYPKESNNGENKIHYGYKVEFDNSLSLKRFLNGYLKYKNF